MAPLGTHVGTVVGNTSPHEFRFFLKSYAAKLGDLVSVEMKIPSQSGGEPRVVTAWARIVELGRFNPFLPAEAGQELAEEGLALTDTVLSVSRDQIEGKALVLGMTDSERSTQLTPLIYPILPGGEMYSPPTALIRSILLGDEEVPRIKVGTLIGRPDVEVKLKTNAVVARHMAILAMTGGGKTVAARRVIRELIGCNYPLLILDPHGDYLGLWTQRSLFPGVDVKLFYPHLVLNEGNIELVGELVTAMTQGLTDPQREVFYDALGRMEAANDEGVVSFIERLLQELGNEQFRPRHPGTVPAIRRQLRLVNRQLEAMERTNQRLREQSAMREFNFERMPDPQSNPRGFIRPRQVSIVYLGGYDHLTQSTIVALIMKELFEHRASMRNQIPPFMTVIEEAHNFIPSRGEGQSETPSVAVIRKVITEGRKFGTGLLLISQRPSRLDETTLSQCNTFMIFRLVNPKDQNFVQQVMENLSKDDSRLLPGFGPGQGIVSGQAVRFPLVIQVDFDHDLIPPNIGDEDFLSAVDEWDRVHGAAVATDDARIAEIDQIASGT